MIVNINEKHYKGSKYSVATSEFIRSTDTTIIWCQHFLKILDLEYPTVISIYLLTEDIKYYPKHQIEIHSTIIFLPFYVL